MQSEGELSLSRLKRKATLPLDVNYGKIEKNRIEVQGFLKKTIEAVVAQSNSNVIDKTPMYRFMKIPPIDISSYGEKTESDGLIKSGQGRHSHRPVPIFLKDPEYSYGNVMSFGHDFKVRVV